MADVAAPGAEAPVVVDRGLWWSARMLAFFVLAQGMGRLLTNHKPAPAPVASTGGTSTGGSESSSVRPMVSLGHEFVVKGHLAFDGAGTSAADNRSAPELTFAHESFRYDPNEPGHVFNVTLNETLLDRVRYTNESMLLHIALSSSTVSITMEPVAVFVYQPARTKHTLKKLLDFNVIADEVIDGGSTGDENANVDGYSAEPPLFEPHLPRNFFVDITYFDERMVFPSESGVPESFRPLIRPGHDGAYPPYVYVNSFWQLHRDRQPLETDNKTADFTVTVKTINSFQTIMYQQVEKSFAQQQQMGMGMDGDEADRFKKMLMDTNPYLLAVTMAVTLLHTVFDVLAFKNEVSHWRNLKSHTGVSVRSMLLSLFCQTVILLYLVDNETTYMVVMSHAVGMAILVWKIGKTIRFERVPGHTVLWGLMPYWKMINNDESAGTSKTDEYDAIAFNYMSKLMYPLVGVYTLYSVLYESHRSWYSFVLNTIVGFIYMAGFLMMVPSVYINYRLKSVAHLPWKKLVYKSLNTFIDDLFAFIIEMPTLHRLATLRDDVIFFIFLYQRWIYPVDNERYNEFNGGEERRAQELAEKEKEHQLAQLPVTKSKTPAIDTAPSEEAVLAQPTTAGKKNE